MIIGDKFVIESISKFIDVIKADLAKWRPNLRPWFRGESSGEDPPLCPKIAKFNASQENHLVQSFRRMAGGLANTPIRGETDKWLFLAQHYGIPTRLLDWTEGALFALFFAISDRRKPLPRVYMLNPHRLNELAMGCESDYLNFPLSWDETTGDKRREGYRNIALAWEERKRQDAYDLPVAVPAIYQDHRMIAQRSCFTVHGRILDPIVSLLRTKGFDVSQCLFEYPVDRDRTDQLMRELSLVGISARTIFPDLDSLAKDLRSELENP